MSKANKCFLVTIFTLFIIIPWSKAQDLSNGQLQSMANSLLIAKKYHVHIKKVLPQINGIQVIVLDMPYREFPGIILINKDKATGKWKRVFECLSPGIQNKSSGLLDWHVKGEGVDFMINGVTTYNFADPQIKTIVETTIKKDGPVLIPYQSFIHMNTAGIANLPEFAPYTLIKHNILILPIFYLMVCTRGILRINA